MPRLPLRGEMVALMLPNVAVATQGAQALKAVRVGALSQGRVMVRLKPSGTAALGAAPAIALMRGALRLRPSAGIQAGVVAAHGCGVAIPKSG